MSNERVQLNSRIPEKTKEKVQLDAVKVKQGSIKFTQDEIVAAIIENFFAINKRKKQRALIYEDFVSA